MAVLPSFSRAGWLCEVSTHNVCDNSSILLENILLLLFLFHNLCLIFSSFQLLFKVVHLIVKQLQCRCFFSRTKCGSLAGTSVLSGLYSGISFLLSLDSFSRLLGFSLFLRFSLLKPFPLLPTDIFLLVRLLPKLSTFPLFVSSSALQFFPSPRWVSAFPQSLLTTCTGSQKINKLKSSLSRV